MRRALPAAATLLIGFAAALPASASASASSVDAERTRYGKVLFDGDGRVLYLFTKEKGERPRCYRACARAWPPFLSDGRPEAEGAVRRRLLGTTKRKNGEKQVTYNGHPLYYYEHDDPGEILCHDVFEFGGDWLVVTARGRPAD